MVWLALFCLIGLAITILVKIGMSPYASAAISGGLPSPIANVSPEKVPPADPVPSSGTGTIARNVQSDTLPKGDRLEVSKPSEASLEANLVKSIVIAPPTEPKKMERIVSRHWHDPFDRQSVPVQPPAKRKASDTSSNRPRIANALAPKP
jgi:hypothetical protein